MGTPAKEGGGHDGTPAKEGGGTSIGELENMVECMESMEATVRDIDARVRGLEDREGSPSSGSTESWEVAARIEEPEGPTRPVGELLCSSCRGFVQEGCLSSDERCHLCITAVP